MCQANNDKGPTLEEPIIISSSINPKKSVVASTPQQIVAQEDDTCQVCGGSQMSNWTSCRACVPSHNN